MATTTHTPYAVGVSNAFGNTQFGGAVSTVYGGDPSSPAAVDSMALVKVRKGATPAGAEPVRSYGNWVSANEVPPPAPRPAAGAYSNSEMMVPIYADTTLPRSNYAQEVLIPRSAPTVGRTMSSFISAAAPRAVPESYMACDDLAAGRAARAAHGASLPPAAFLSDAYPADAYAADDAEYSSVLAEQNARDYARSFVAAIPPKPLATITRAAAGPSGSYSDAYAATAASVASLRPPPLHSRAATTPSQIRMLAVVDALITCAHSLWLGPQTFTVQRLDTLRDLILERPIDEAVLRDSLNGIVADAGRDAGPLTQRLHEALERMAADVDRLDTVALPVPSISDAPEAPYDTVYTKRRPRPPATPQPSLWQRVELQQNTDPHVLRARAVANKVRRSELKSMGPSGEFRRAIDDQMASAARLEARRAEQYGLRVSVIRQRQAEEASRAAAEAARLRANEARRAEAEYLQEAAAAEAERRILAEREQINVTEAARLARAQGLSPAAAKPRGLDPAARARVQEKMSRVTEAVVRDPRLATDLSRSAAPEAVVENAVISNMHSPVQMMLVLRGLKDG